MSKDIKKEEKKELTPSEKRQLKAQLKLSEETKEIDHKEEFRKFFIQLKTKHKLDPELENVIWVHLKASGYAEQEKFEDGLVHFGFKF